MSQQLTFADNKFNDKHAKIHTRPPYPQDAPCPTLPRGCQGEYACVSPLNDAGIQRSLPVVGCDACFLAPQEPALPPAKLRFVVTVFTQYLFERDVMF